MVQATLLWILSRMRTNKEQNQKGRIVLVMCCSQAQIHLWLCVCCSDSFSGSGGTRGTVRHQLVTSALFYLGAQHISEYPVFQRPILILKGLQFRKVNFKHVPNHFPESKHGKSTFLVQFLIDFVCRALFIILVESIHFDALILFNSWHSHLAFSQSYNKHEDFLLEV